MQSTAETILPLQDMTTPENEEELIAIVRNAAQQQIPLYPIGGGSGLQFGLPAKRPGIGVSLERMQRVLDYPARDMTITVQAGLGFQVLQETLAAEGQWLPLDPPQSERAQLGGLVATNASGPRRYGYGTAREYVIGIRAVDGRGVPFQAGGRVVKNVAGYDFCRLLSGSRGTLAIITQITWKLRPRPHTQAVLLWQGRDWLATDRALASCNISSATPTAITLHRGDADGQPSPQHLGILVEGTEAEVTWQIDALRRELERPGMDLTGIERDAEATPRLAAWRQFPVAEHDALRFRVQVLPSATTQMIRAVWEQLPDARVMAHAGSGVIDFGLSELPELALSRLFTQQLTPLAHRWGGHLVVTYHATGQELTPELMWGGAAVPWRLMGRIRKQFDPHGILNPQRFFQA